MYDCVQRERVSCLRGSFLCAAAGGWKSFRLPDTRITITVLFVIDCALFTCLFEKIYRQAAVDLATPLPTCTYVLNPPQTLQQC
jgi:hypothetical protein